jgi:superfamily II DNA or RNA helicase
MSLYRRNIIRESISEQLYNLLYLFNSAIIETPTETAPQTDLLDTLFDVGLTRKYSRFVTDDVEREEAYKKLRPGSYRPGQKQFKNRLLNLYYPAYSRVTPRCAVTSTPLMPYLIEAAHIKPYSVDADNHENNGILLRVDIHRLWDSFVIGFEPQSDETYILRINEELRRQLAEHKLCQEEKEIAHEYCQLEGAQLDFGPTPNLPNKIEMQKRWEKFLEKEAPRLRYRRNDSKLATLPKITKIKSGLQITTKTACYQLLGHADIHHEYFPYEAMRKDCPNNDLPLYYYKFPITLLKNQPRMFDVFRRLFMGDPELISMLSDTSKYFSLTPIQYTAIFGNQLPSTRDGYKPGFVGSLDRGDQRGLLVMPTGTGKTITAACCYRWLADQSPEKKPRVLFIAHQRMLVTNAEKTFREFANVSSTAIIHSGKNRNINGKRFTNLKKVGDHLNEVEAVFITRSTLYNFLTKRTYAPSDKENFAQGFDLIIIDEAHHTSQPDEKEDKVDEKALKEYALIVKNLKPRYLLGMTATPYEETKSIFKKIIYSFSDNIIHDLTDGIRRGYLTWCNYRQIQDVHKNTPKNISTRQAKSFIKKKIEEKPSLGVILDQVKYWSGIPQDDRQWYALKEAHQSQEDHLVSDSIQKVISQYERLSSFTGYNRTLIYCNSRIDCINTSSYLYTKGIRARFLISEPKQLIKQLISKKQITSEIENLILLPSQIRKFKDDVLCVVGMADEGIDIPDITTIIFATTTKSKVKFFQRIGRGLRLHQTKRCVEVIDLLSNYSTYEDFINAGKLLTKTSVASYGNRRLYALCYNCGTKNGRDVKNCETCEILLTDQGNDMPGMGYDGSYSLGLRSIVDQLGDFSFPPILQEQIKIWRREQGLTEDEIIAELETLIKTDEFTTMGKVKFPGSPQIYHKKDLLRLLKRSWDAVHGVIEIQLDPNTSLRELAELDSASSFFGNDEYGLYYLCYCGHHTYNLNLFTCDSEACLEKESSVFLIDSIYPEDLELRVRLLLYYLDRPSSAPDDYAERYRFITGLYEPLIASDQFKQRLVEAGRSDILQFYFPPALNRFRY